MCTGGSEDCNWIQQYFVKLFNVVSKLLHVFYVIFLNFKVECCKMFVKECVSFIWCKERRVKLNFMTIWYDGSDATFIHKYTHLITLWVEWFSNPQIHILDLEFYSFISFFKFVPNKIRWIHEQSSTSQLNLKSNLDEFGEVVLWLNIMFLDYMDTGSLFNFCPFVVGKRLEILWPPLPVKNYWRL